MKNYRFLLPFCLLLLTFSLSSCDLVGDIFKAGAWTALIGVFLVVLLLWFLVRKIRR
ncbi:hypothetical protein [Hymenobacter metallicola]|uniref:hypothetical protein n=1 Tax=Hymenobacter metallicola TaxID=2563114 RepID=UPI0014369711|nr:hypothetical protein [Hymenobacter metallicola]